MNEKVKSPFKGQQLSPNQHFCVAKSPTSGGCVVRLYSDHAQVWQSGADVERVPYERGWFYYVDRDGDLARRQRTQRTYAAGSKRAPVQARAPIPHAARCVASHTSVETDTDAPDTVSSRRLSVCFVIDSSLSMQGIAQHARAAFDAQLSATTAAAIAEGVSAVVSIVSFGSSLEELAVAIPASKRPRLSSYNPNQSSTRVFDAVVRASELCERSAQPGDSKLIVVVTDGEDNASTRKVDFGALMRRVAADPTWTVTFMLPLGSKRSFCSQHGVPEGNVSEWETGTAKGVAAMSATQVTAVSSYVGAVARGVTGTKTFYASTDHIATRDLETSADDVTDRALVWRVNAVEQIRPFVERHLPSSEIFRLGAAFYQLTEREEVQEHKSLLIRERSGRRRIFGGRAVRSMLNLPAVGKVWVAPDAKSQYDVFVQSTSVNRKLTPNTDLVYWT